MLRPFRGLVLLSKSSAPPASAAASVRAVRRFAAEPVAERGPDHHDDSAEAAFRPARAELSRQSLRVDDVLANSDQTGRLRRAGARKEITDERRRARALSRRCKYGARCGDPKCALAHPPSRLLNLADLGEQAAPGDRLPLDADASIIGAADSDAPVSPGAADEQPRPAADPRASSGAAPAASSFAADADVEASDRPSDSGLLRRAGPHLALCRFGSKCEKPQCRFVHPEGRDIDVAADPTNTNFSSWSPSSAVADFKQIPCRDGIHCTRLDCVFAHPLGRSIAAKDRVVGRGPEPSPFQAFSKGPTTAYVSAGPGHHAVGPAPDDPVRLLIANLRSFAEAGLWPDVARNVRQLLEWTRDEHQLTAAVATLLKAVSRYPTLPAQAQRALMPLRTVRWGTENRQPLYDALKGLHDVVAMERFVLTLQSLGFQPDVDMFLGLIESAIKSDAHDDRALHYFRQLRASRIPVRRVVLEMLFNSLLSDRRFGLMFEMETVLRTEAREPLPLGVIGALVRAAGLGNRPERIGDLFDELTNRSEDRAKAVGVAIWAAGKCHAVQALRYYLTYMELHKIPMNFGIAYALLSSLRDDPTHGQEASRLQQLVTPPQVFKNWQPERPLPQSANAELSKFVRTLLDSTEKQPQKQRK